MNQKNKYVVMIVYSSHQNWDNAVANRDTQKQSGRDARIYYRGHEVTSDVKKIVKEKGEGGMKREDVYELIDGERDYQYVLWNIKHDQDASISDWILYIEHQLREAKDKLYHESDNKNTLSHIRKIAALAVACMENNETLPRE